MNMLVPQRRPKAPRSVAVAAPRPRPTLGSALLLAGVLSAPFALIAVVQALV
ncbi:hypothetical protein [Salipiger sp.]|uniref:hypothetical protein n=1 Tax=Salipiger sp. TaxID=2078585 RepID=UPI003A987AF5